MDFNFYLSSALLGLGLAMDACAVSMANGLKEPKMSIGKTSLIALMFAIFQAIMPLIGWICVHTIVESFTAFDKVVPFIALGLLAFIGGKMLYEGFHDQPDDQQTDGKSLTFVALIMQAIATSIDALSVGFTIADYNLTQALVSVAVISLVTFIVCFVAVFLGKKFGTKLGNKAIILGGLILIGIGIEIFINGVFF